MEFNFIAKGNYNLPPNIFQTQKEKEDIESLWLEADVVPDKTWLMIFEDIGNIPANHMIITECTTIDPKIIFDLIQRSKQVCFQSAMVPGSTSLNMVIKLLEALYTLNVSGKIFRTGAYLLEMLNDKFDIKHQLHLCAQFFEDNQVFELHESQWKRIQYNNQTNKFEYENSNIIKKSI